MKLEIYGIVCSKKYIRDLGVEYLIDDGTGILTCIEWFEKNYIVENLPDIGASVHIFGRIGSYLNNVQLIINNIKIINDADYESFHFLKSIESYRYNKKLKIKVNTPCTENVNRLIPKHQFRVNPVKEPLQIVKEPKDNFIEEILYPYFETFAEKYITNSKYYYFIKSEFYNSYLMKSELISKIGPILSKAKKESLAPQLTTLLWNYSLDKGHLFHLKYIKPLSINLIKELAEHINRSKIENTLKLLIVDKINSNEPEIENDFLYFDLRADILNLYVLDLLLQFETLSLSQIEQRLKKWFTKIKSVTILNCILNLLETKKLCEVSYQVYKVLR